MDPHETKIYNAILIAAGILIAQIVAFYFHTNHLGTKAPASETSTG